MQTIITIDTITAPASNDFNQLNQFITDQLTSHVELISHLAQYIIDSGGKRLRPLLVLLSARACGYKENQHVATAAIIEFIHTATLLHDDVVDHSDLRRGQKTAHTIWGSEASVLVGDFLYSRAFQMMVKIQQHSQQVMEILADTTNAIAEGEVLQLIHCNDAATTEADYMNVIYHKTARLFTAGSQLGAVLANQPEAIQQHMAAYGTHLGNAFQIIDDALDYCANAEQIGKNIGDDLAQGKPTLPLIHVLQTGNDSEQQLIRNALENPGSVPLEKILLAIESTSAIAYTYSRAEEQVAQALAHLVDLPASPCKTALEDLANFALQRRF